MSVCNLTRTLMYSVEISVNFIVKSPFFKRISRSCSICCYDNSDVMVVFAEVELLLGTAVATTCGFIASSGVPAD